jgi:DNA segregation ATPase FtsK/SpoIIIE-like protein
MGKKKDSTGTEASGAKETMREIIIRELWAVAFLALGVLAAVALISSIATPADNLLGKFVGKALADGMVYILGVLQAFVVPGIILYIGWQKLIDAPLRIRPLVLTAALTIETCILFAVINLPAAAAGVFTITHNALGNLLVYLMHYVFGPHRFGPYFITSLILIATICWGFGVRVTTFLHFFHVVLRAVGNWFKQSFAAAWQSLTKPRAPKEEVQKASRENTVPVASVTALAASSVDADTGMQAVQQNLLDELAAFRAKKAEPFSITTMDAPHEAAEVFEENAPEDEDVPPEFLAGGYGGGKSDAALEKGKVRSKPSKPYRIPSPEILQAPPDIQLSIDKDRIIQNSYILEKTLLNFGIEGKVFNVSSGPFVTRYEIELAPGVKVSKVVSLQDDISMAVGGQKIRIEAPIPGKAAIGIELPNPEKQTVYFKHILMADTFRKSKSRLPMIIGQNISGVPYVTDITKMPHLLIAGQTGSGKSVCINSLICSLLMTRTPEELRLILVDPKKVELAIYEGIPHLLSPVVTESKEAVKALYWATQEMDRRYRLLSKIEGTRNLDSFNTRIAAGKYKEGILTEDERKPLPFIVIIVDELADLMITASKDVETLIQRIAQLGRAAGVHLIVATQRPSVDIITGPIKANLTSRISFRTIQSTDSRTILGHVGAEKLLGMGDMLFLRNGAPDIERYHGAFLSEEDVEAIVGDINKQNIEIEKIETFSDIVGDGLGGGDESSFGGDGSDEFFEQAARMVVSLGQGSTSLLQRRLSVGYARAGRLMDQLERAGIVGPQEGSKVREVRMETDELERLLMQIRDA